MRFMPITLKTAAAREPPSFTISLCPISSKSFYEQPQRKGLGADRRAGESGHRWHNGPTRAAQSGSTRTMTPPSSLPGAVNVAVCRMSRRTTPTAALRLMLSRIHHPVLVANGDQDKMVLTCRNQQRNDGHFYRLALRLRTFQQRDQALTGFAPIPNLSKSNQQKLLCRTSTLCT